MRRGAVAEIDLDAVTHNLGVVRKLTNNRSVISVVKADAYGHGAIEVSRRLERDGVSHLAVAFVEEAIKLRNAGIRSPIIVLFDKQDVPMFFEHNLIPTVHDIQFAGKLSAEARKRKRPLDVHVKIDTGMGRLGFNHDGLLDDVMAIAEMEFLNIKGLMSHFSDSDVAEKSFAEIQIKKFLEIKSALFKKMKRPKSFLCHMANSAATMTLKDAHFDAVRPGIMLYGCSPLGDSNKSIVDSQKSKVKSKSLKIRNPKSEIRNQDIQHCDSSSLLARYSSLSLKPVMKLKTEILSVRKVGKGTPVSYGRTFVTRRESLIAVLPVGYADGFNRMFSNNAEVIVKGKRAPVVGRVCMDLTMVDVTGIRGVRVGDEVVLMGGQGGEEITALEMAANAGTIPYEILTAMGTRSRRVYIPGG